MHANEKFDGPALVQLKEIMKTNTTDADKDVGYFATVALNALN